MGFHCRLQLPYIAMYRKEDISCLLKDPETGEDVSHDKPALKRHKVTSLKSHYLINHSSDVDILGLLMTFVFCFDRESIRNMLLSTGENLKIYY